MSFDTLHLIPLQLHLHSRQTRRQQLAHYPKDLLTRQSPRNPNLTSERKSGGERWRGGGGRWRVGVKDEGKGWGWRMEYYFGTTLGSKLIQSPTSVYHLYRPPPAVVPAVVTPSVSELVTSVGDDLTSSLFCLHCPHPSIFSLPSPSLFSTISLQSHKVPIAPLPPPTVPIGSDYICPQCGQHDDGTPMICCDSCDEWLHWWVIVCVVGMGMCLAM